MVITATERLARARRQEYDWEQQGKGLPTWTSAPVKTLDMWLSELWEQGMFSEKQLNLPRPLRSAEELIIWEEIMRSHSMVRPLDLSATAELVCTSWKLVCDWGLPLTGIEWRSSEDTRAFQEWAQEFRARCDRNGWFSASELSERVVHLIRRGDLTLPDEVLIVGFLERTPTQNRFFESLQEQGTRIHEAPLPNRRGRAIRLKAGDVREEIHMSAEWARSILLRDPNAANPSFQIGIIVPNIRRLRTQVEREFSEVFHPCSWLQPERDPNRLFNISLGLPASDYPLIQSGLQILSMDVWEIPIEDASRLLLSPFLPGYDLERTSRALLDVALRSRREAHVTLEDIRYLASKKKVDFYCPVLAAIVSKWQRKFAELKGRKRPSVWAESFSRLLSSTKQNAHPEDPEQVERVGWPGNCSYGSIEYQTCMVWEELLSGLVELDGICGSITRQQAVSLMRRMASSKLFQPESDPAPVQILGILEASGLSFDYLWMLGMHDDAWPLPCTPAPFVPIRLQRQHNLWRSTPDGMLENARQLGNRLLMSSPEVVISHPVREGDTDRRVSPLFARVPEGSILDQNIEHIQYYAEKLQHSSRLERLEDHQAPPCEDHKFLGGTELFKLQAACPFRAFAELRLGATAPAFPDSGLNALDRGRLMHRVLDSIWKQLSTQKQLLALSKEDEAVLVQHIVKEELSKSVKSRRALRNQRFLQIEQSRLEKITKDWLSLERQRMPFVVAEREEIQRVTIGGMEIDIREDRVDLLENGEKVILDYKTGECRTSLWEGDRPDDPQLPIYAVIEDPPIAGIFFGSLKVGQLGFRGISNEGGVVPGSRPPQTPLSDLIDQWSNTLNRLGQEYKSGCAVVDPKYPTRTCKYCKLATFCRVGGSTNSQRHQG